MTIAAIQILRAFAALLVVAHHAQFEAAALAARTAQDFTPSALLPWAAGVDVFFVISGFIIVHAARPLYGRPGGRARFLAHRLARIAPLYWLVTGLYLAIIVATPSLLSGEASRDLLRPDYVAASLLFWPALRPDGAAQPLFTLGWTLNCEVFFYLLFAIGIGWGRRAAFAWTAGALSLLALAGALAPGLPMPLLFWTHPIILEFAFGAAIGLARAEGLRLSPIPRLALALAGLALLSVAGEPGEAARPLAYGVPALMLVMAAALGSAPDASRPWRAVAWLAVLGDASYALYLTHPFALRATRAAITGLGLPVAPWAAIALMLALSIVVALAVFHAVEAPLTRWARGRLDARLAPVAGVATTARGKHP